MFAPLVSPGGLTIFGRDIASSRQVWSAGDGYPGNPVYRDFYRDIGYDLDYAYVKPYLPDDGERAPLGIKYYRVTGCDSKKMYNPEAAGDAVRQDAHHFMQCRKQQIDQLSALLDRPPVVVTAFDAELFGHWWHEGLQWLDAFIRTAAENRHHCPLITPTDYLERYPAIQHAAPSPSSWGWGGYSEAWVNDTNAWIYPPLHKAAQRMVALSEQFPHAEGVSYRALNQAARELLLAQSSDWPFIMTTGTVPHYARKRFTAHLENFSSLRKDILSGTINIHRLRELETTNTIFPHLDYRVYTCARRSADLQPTPE